MEIKEGGRGSVFLKTWLPDSDFSSYEWERVKTKVGVCGLRAKWYFVLLL